MPHVTTHIDCHSPSIRPTERGEKFAEIRLSALAG